MQDLQYKQNDRWTVTYLCSVSELGTFTLSLSFHIWCMIYCYPSILVVYFFLNLKTNNRWLTKKFIVSFKCKHIFKLKGLCVLRGRPWSLMHLLIRSSTTYFSSKVLGCVALRLISWLCCCYRVYRAVASMLESIGQWLGVLADSWNSNGTDKFCLGFSHW